MNCKECGNVMRASEIVSGECSVCGTKMDNTKAGTNANTRQKHKQNKEGSRTANIYTIEYLEGTELKTAHVEGNNATEAEKVFFKMHPGVNIDKIVNLMDMNESTSDYNASIGIAKIISFLGWFVVAGGIIFGFAGGFLFNLMGTVSIVSLGLLLVLTGHIARATLATANYTKQILDEMRTRK